MPFTKTVSFKRTIVASILMLMPLGFFNYFSHGENIPLNKPFSTFPKQIGEWTGKEAHFSQRIYEVLGVDDSIVCNYSAPSGYHSSGSQIELYIGFYRSQRKGELIHSPKNCMPGAGWDFTKTRKISIPFHDRQKQNVRQGTITVNNILLQKGTEKLVMFYWYQGRGRVMTSEYMQKIYLVTDSITKHRTDEAFVRILSPVMNGSEEETVRHLQDFTERLLPLLQEYIPS